MVCQIYGTNISTAIGGLRQDSANKEEAVMEQMNERGSSFAEGWGRPLEEKIG